ncbi:MAG TPA: Fe(3+)-siderophore ABC transporter permease [Plantibacter sp.]|uniref:Fe(3+)-siderophore ABC transporter permease n=1 Tax=unclassified Plantibacter TaxID=2624265 RepID=UPI002BDC7229|nr:Fe(3+)-siderophore ABC transporter permease [Plantibacter sp.]
MTVTREARTSLEQPLARGVAHRDGVRATGLLISVCVLIVVIALSLMVGSKSIDAGTVWHALLGAPVGDDGSIVLELRLPRTILGVLVGVALGLSGALIQALTRNPLADPGILGVNAGAGFAVVLAVALLGITSIHQYLWFSFLGAVVATVLVSVIGSAGRGGATPVRLTLAGIALAAVLGGVSSGITLLAPRVFDAMRYWGAGNIANRPPETLAVIVPFIVVGVVIALAVAKPLNAVAMGDDLAATLGARLGRTRVLVIVAVTLLCGAATAAAGPIGFVGLMVPHIVRWFVGPDQRWILAYTIVLAPVLLLASDIVGRVVMSSGELQVGIVTAFIGAPVLIVLVRGKRVSGL